MLAKLERLNALQPYPLDHSELRWIAKSVESYRAKWQAQGRFYTEEEIFAYQSGREQHSGQARRANTKERDKAITALYATDQYTQRQFAEQAGLTHLAVNHVLQWARHNLDA